MDSKPKARKEEIVVQRLADEVLVYDLKRHKAFCLNETAALIWKHCDGKTDPARLTEILEQERGTPIDEDVLWLGLEQLSRSNLLEKPQESPLAKPKISRRDLIRRIGISAAIILPLVMSITAPVAAQTATCVPAGGMCSMNSDCCSNMHEWSMFVMPKAGLEYGRSLAISRTRERCRFRYARIRYNALTRYRYAPGTLVS